MLSTPNLALFGITLLSGLVALFAQKKYDLSIKLLLAFSGAFLLATCVLHLLPEIFEEKRVNAAPFILIGFFLQILIEYVSQGVEHGHIHKPKSSASFPFLIYLGLCVHAFAEGLPLSGIENAEMSLPPLFWGILLHKVPIIVILVTLLLAYNVNRSFIMGCLAVFAFMTPLGGYMGSLIAGGSSEVYLTYFLAASTGIFLHISTVILFETSHDHRFNLIKFIFILAGGLLSVIIF